jgi:hypothetical protein
MKNGQIYDGSSIKLFEDSFKGAYGEMNAKRGIIDSTTIAAGGSYLEQQLREVLPEVLSELYPEMPLLNILSVDNSGALSQSIIQRAKNFDGEHKFNHEAGKTKGVITVNRTAREQLIYGLDAESSYTDIDLQRSILLNEKIDVELIEGHNQSYMKLIDQIGFEGISLPNVGTVTEGLTNFSQPDPDLIRTSSNTFNNLTGLEIYNEIRDLRNKMVAKAGNNAELRPNVVILPVEQYDIVISSLMTGTSPVVSGDYTVAGFIEKNLGLKLYSSNRLIDKGVGTTDRMIMLNNDRRNIRFHIPTPLRFAPVTVKGFNYLLESNFRIAGVGFNRSNAIGYLDAI